MARKQSPDLVEVLEAFEKAKRHHDVFRDQVVGRYKAYRGIIDRRSQAASWTTKLHPPVIQQVLETTVANIIDQTPRLRIKPRPRSGTPDEIKRHIDGARTLERLLLYEFDVDRFAEKQRTFILQGLITGLSVGKVSWSSKKGDYRTLAKIDRPVYDQYGSSVGSFPDLVEEERTGYLIDDPTFENINVLDFFWPEQAVELQQAPWVIHRVWKSYEELQELQKRGIYRNVSELGQQREFQDEGGSWESELFDTDRTKDTIELLEYWNKLGNKVITIANRTVVLSSKKWPFHHGEYPFVVTSATPDLFRIPGISQVELLWELQEMLWSLMNQRLDNLQLINNAIILIRSDVDDPDAFEFAPGEKWLVDGEPESAVKMWSPDPTAAQISLEAERLILGQIQNLTGGGIFASGTESSTIDQKTATGVSIVTSLAQRLLAAKKQNYMWAFDRVGDQFIQLLQQFMREDRLIDIVGPEGVNFLQIEPEEIQGRYRVSTEMVNESLMRQERRAEAQALYQVAVQAAPLHAALAQAGAARPLNVDAFMEDLLESFDRLDKERYFAQPQQPQPQVGGGQQPPGAASLPAEQGPGGVTSPLASGPSSPSNQVSQSPEVFLQRALASQGGANNV